MWVESVGQAAAVDVEGFEDLADRVGVDAPGQGPANDVEVFLAGFEAVEDAIEEKRVVVKAAFEKSKITAVEFHPKTFPLQMFQPACS